MINNLVCLQAVFMASPLLNIRHLWKVKIAIVMYMSLICNVPLTLKLYRTYKQYLVDYLGHILKSQKTFCAKHFLDDSICFIGLRCFSSRCFCCFSEVFAMKMVKRRVFVFTFKGSDIFLVRPGTNGIKYF